MFVSFKADELHILYPPGDPGYSVFAPATEDGEVELEESFVSPSSVEQGELDYIGRLPEVSSGPVLDAF